MLGYENPDQLVGRDFYNIFVNSPHARANCNHPFHWNGRVSDYLSYWLKKDGSELLICETGWIIPGERGAVTAVLGVSDLD